jgi:L-threonylcarbamoyladenylate synthase
VSAGVPLRAASAVAVAEAAELIRQGRLVAFPTETVYGLGADAGNDDAIAAVFAVKDRPTFNPLIVHVTGLAEAERLALFDERARRLAAAFWPGPLTLVLPRRNDASLSLLVSAGLDTVAVRAPRHPLAQALLAACGRPVAAPSANRSGAVSPTTARHVAESFGAESSTGGVAMILDGGPCAVGIESTVVDLTGARPALLRHGGIPGEEIEAVIGPMLSPNEGGSPGEGAPRSPGMLRRHYAPRLPLRLNVAAPRQGEALLAFGPSDHATRNLSPAGDLREAAANFFAMLRELDRGPYSGIAVSPVPERGLGRAINDRLRRGAAPPSVPDSRASGQSEDDWNDPGTGGALSVAWPRRCHGR